MLRKMSRVKKSFMLGVGVFMFAFVSMSMYDYAQETSGWCLTCTDGPGQNWGHCDGPRGIRICVNGGFTCDDWIAYSCGSGGGPIEH